MKQNQKLELNWIGKHDPENKINPEPRILIEKPEYSYSKSEKETEGQLSLEENSEKKQHFDNMLIHGDNLLALKSLEFEYAGKIKCIYIDPPYNTGSAFEHYDDNLEHSTWLNLMKPRLELLKNLLSDDGVIFVQIDDEEQAYLKILCDEVFGRNNFISTICVKMSTVSGVKTSHRDKTIIKVKEMILVYAKDSAKYKVKPQYVPVLEWDNEFQYFLNKNNSADPNDWKVERLLDVLEKNNLVKNFSNKKTQEFVHKNRDKIWRRAFIRNEYKELSQKNPGKIFYNQNGNKDHYYYKGREMFFLKDKFCKCFTEDGYVETTGILLGDIWLDVNTGKLFNEGFVEFRNGKKPEFLVARILEMSTNPGDIVLDSFLGSGTTAAVAHKMGRRWIGIELGEHAYTHCYPRIKAVIDGEQGGISKAVNWRGGGGFKFYELAPSLIEKCKYGNPIISKEYSPESLAKALARHEGYYYEPDSEMFWKQSKNGENNFLFVTTNYITPEYLEYIHSQMKSDEHLLICTKACKTECANQFSNITIHQIPKILLGKCEFSKDNYNLNVKENENSEDEEWEDKNG